MRKPWFNHSCISKQEFHLSNAMRLVWEQHVYWTRMTINSIAFGLPDIDAVTTRLLRNATDMANLLKPFYGNRIAAKFTKLLRDHLIIAAELVNAAKAGDQEAVADAQRRWNRNGEDIAKFLSRINPFISRDEFQEMFFEHLEITTKQALLILQNKFRSSIFVFDEIELQALQMADTLTKAIVRQFPRRFRIKIC
ncbi:acetylglutamate kinase [Evansella sp. AB-P1]|uniref:acetylglutamate kinase n=1 Tax=Evansella sp. AB-P1 TaxID=3037653 RepID=UPI00241FC52F|nr:acetylglutamate kinase [Evansella sp. AB-P1]MDG5789890.1 acetylglutamate kinase [Evansella sp. AB-P1]